MESQANNLAQSVQDFLQDLENVGPLWNVLKNGILPKQVKNLLEALSPVQRRAYFNQSGRGVRLISAVCYNGILSEVRYIFERLRVHDVDPDSVGILDAVTLCPIMSALSSPKPSVDVIFYVASLGYPITEDTYRCWAACCANQHILRAILQILVQHAPKALPPIPSFLRVLGFPEGTFTDRYSVHIDLLKGLNLFTPEDMRFAAQLGLGRILGQLAEDLPSLDQDELADLYELCEFANYRRNKNFPRKLYYFRKSIQIRKNPERRRRMIYKSWKLFETLEDIERIEDQMANNDYVECNRQMLLIAGRGERAMRGDVSLHATKGFVNLEQLSEVKDFVLKSGHFKGFAWQFFRGLKKRCQIVVENTDQPTLEMLPKLYDCLKEIFIDGDEPLSWGLLQAIVYVLTKTSTQSDVIEQLNQLVERRDELLFMVIYSLQEPNNYHDDKETLKLVAPMMARLLRMGASLGTLPEHMKSNLRLLMGAVGQLNPSLRDALQPHICCPLDLLPEEREALDLPQKTSSPLSLKCIAASACRKFPLQLLQQTLPRDLVSMAKCHPSVEYEPR